ncbi:hypothetical protein NLU13_8052 [Sarocladium strictum]|uniref:Uncharacterized protein n=1 Tax=Sarocladium strictum TaxID=5046 RepID=A0AA39GAX7_SARSR|nr:hypothetical protein NLU13_8052 [Sarocladium strictum]
MEYEYEIQDKLEIHQALFRLLVWMIRNLLLIAASSHAVSLAAVSTLAYFSAPQTWRESWFCTYFVPLAVLVLIPNTLVVTVSIMEGVTISHFARILLSLAFPVLLDMYTTRVKAAKKADPNALLFLRFDGISRFLLKCMNAFDDYLKTTQIDSPTLEENPDIPEETSQEDTPESPPQTPSSTSSSQKSKDSTPSWLRKPKPARMPCCVNSDKCFLPKGGPCPCHRANGPKTRRLRAQFGLDLPPLPIRDPKPSTTEPAEPQMPAVINPEVPVAQYSPEPCTPCPTKSEVEKAKDRISERKKKSLERRSTTTRLVVATLSVPTTIFSYSPVSTPTGWTFSEAPSQPYTRRDDDWKRYDSQPRARMHPTNRPTSLALLKQAYYTALLGSAGLQKCSASTHRLLARKSGILYGFLYRRTLIRHSQIKARLLNSGCDVRKRVVAHDRAMAIETRTPVLAVLKALQERQPRRQETYARMASTPEAAISAEEENQPAATETAEEPGLAEIAAVLPVPEAPRTPEMAMIIPPPTPKEVSSASSVKTVTFAQPKEQTTPTAMQQALATGDIAAPALEDDGITASPHPTESAPEQMDTKTNVAQPSALDPTTAESAPSDSNDTIMAEDNSFMISDEATYYMDVMDMQAADQPEEYAAIGVVGDSLGYASGWQDFTSQPMGFVSDAGPSGGQQDLGMQQQQQTDAAVNRWAMIHSAPEETTIEPQAMMYPAPDVAMEELAPVAQLPSMDFSSLGPWVNEMATAETGPAPVIEQPLWAEDGQAEMDDQSFSEMMAGADEILAAIEEVSSRVRTNVEDTNIELQNMPTDPSIGVDAAISSHNADAVEGSYPSPPEQPIEASDLDMAQALLSLGQQQPPSQAQPQIPGLDNLAPPPIHPAQLDPALFGNMDTLPTSALATTLAEGSAAAGGSYVPLDRTGLNEDDWGSDIDKLDAHFAAHPDGVPEGEGELTQLDRDLLGMADPTTPPAANNAAIPPLLSPLGEDLQSHGSSEGSKQADGSDDSGGSSESGDRRQSGVKWAQRNDDDDVPQFLAIPPEVLAMQQRMAAKPIPAATAGEGASAFGSPGTPGFGSGLGSNNAPSIMPSRSRTSDDGDDVPLFRTIPADVAAMQAGFGKTQSRGESGGNVGAGSTSPAKTLSSFTQGSLATTSATPTAPIFDLSTFNLPTLPQAPPQTEEDVSDEDDDPDTLDRDAPALFARIPTADEIATQLAAARANVEAHRAANPEDRVTDDDADAQIDVEVQSEVSEEE